MLQQVLGHGGQRFGIILRAQAQGARKAHGRWRGHARRADKGKELRHVEVLLLLCRARQRFCGCRLLRQTVNQE